jgi:peptidoglycan/xylan/chitin deacetylase (PgdA/CDA1 family)
MAMNQGEGGRDFFGYGEHPPHPRWPDGARIAVSLVLNVEEGSEHSIRAGDNHNEAVYDMVSAVHDVPDASMESHFEYGTRAGYWRVVHLLERYGITCTVNACAQALELSPWLARDCVARGFEIACHGYRWQPHGTMSEEVEREQIRCAVAAIQSASGIRPRGWHTRNPASVNTRRLLVEEGGFLYDSDAANDDLPWLTKVGNRQHVVLPYSLDTNDMRLQRPEGMALGSHLAEYVNEAFDWLWEEGATAPKMMTIGLHLRIIGRPGRIRALQSILEHITSRPAVWITQRQLIAEHWLRRFGEQPAE